MKSLTIAYITAREKPRFDWTFAGIVEQCGQKSLPEIIVVNTCDIAPQLEWDKLVFSPMKEVRPKPTPWQGECRQTKSDYFAVANARNTAFALCRTEWVAFLDDRCVLMPGWLDAIKRAMEGEYAVCGAYEKRHGMVVENGQIVEPGMVTGRDHRERHGYGPCNGGWWFGCTNALPLEWALQVNGYDESCDGMGYEDTPFGMMLQNSGYPIRYDPAMKVIQDRTPELSGPTMLRVDKGVSPNDKSHAMVARLKGRKESTNPYSLRDLRERMLAGGSWPHPEPNQTDWYDGQLLSEM